MENEADRNLKMFARAAEEIMGITDDIHALSDSLLEEILKEGTDTKQTLILESVSSLRYLLRKINVINMEKLFGVPRTFLEEGE